MTKNFKLSAEQIQPLALGWGGCVATDMITVEGLPVGLMYRERPTRPEDSGWRFLSGFESDAYMHDLNNHAVYDVNTIANYDRRILPFLEAPIGSAFEKDSTQASFVAVTDWKAGD